MKKQESIRVVPSSGSIIEDTLLTSLGFGEKVAVVFTEELLDKVIGWLELEPSVYWMYPGRKAFVENLKTLRQQAFGAK